MIRKEISTIILFFVTILVFILPTISQAESQIKIHKKYTFDGSKQYLASPLVIINNEKQYKDFIANTHIYISGSRIGETNYNDKSFEYPKIDFKKQCMILLNAPGHEAPIIKSINYKKNEIILDIEYSEYFSLGNGWFNCTAIHIDRPKSPIKLSEKSLRQHEKIYGKKLILFKNSINHTVNKKVYETCQKSINNIFIDMLKLKNKYSELDNFTKNNAWKDPETKEIYSIEYENYITVIPKRDIIPEKDGLWLIVYILYPITPHEIVPQLSRTFEIEYENICVRVCVTLHTNNKELEDKILNIIKKRSVPIEKLNNKT